MTWLVGQETCLGCGETSIVLAPAETVESSHSDRECEFCGARLVGVATWFPGDYYREAVTLIEFELARAAAGLEQCRPLRRQ